MECKSKENLCEVSIWKERNEETIAVGIWKEEMIAMKYVNISATWIYWLLVEYGENVCYSVSQCNTCKYKYENRKLLYIFFNPCYYRKKLNNIRQSNERIMYWLTMNKRDCYAETVWQNNNQLLIVNLYSYFYCLYVHKFVHLFSVICLVFISVLDLFFQYIVLV